MNTSNKSDITNVDPRVLSPKRQWDVCRFCITVVMTAVILLANLAVTSTYAIMKKIDRDKIPNYCLFHQSLVDIVVGVVFLLYELYNSNVLRRSGALITPFQHHMARYTKFVCKPFTVLLCVATLIMSTADR